MVKAKKTERAKASRPTRAQLRQLEETIKALREMAEHHLKNSAQYKTWWTECQAQVVELKADRALLEKELWSLRPKLAQAEKQVVAAQAQIDRFAGFLDGSKEAYEVALEVLADRLRTN